MPWGDIDDDAIAEGKKLVGTDLPPWVRWVSDVNQDSITHFNEGVGEYNPLFNEPAYAEQSSAKVLLAPPTFLFAVEMPATGVAFPGVGLVYGGAEFTMWDWVRSGDRLDATTKLTDQVEKSGRFSDRWIIQTTRTTYVREPDREPVGQVIGASVRLPSAAVIAAEGKNKYGSRKAGNYTREEIRAIEEAMLSEPVRGAEPRYIEDVEVGEELPPVTRGPLTGTDIMAVYAAILGARAYGGTGAGAIRYRRKTGQFYENEETGAMDALGRGHLEAENGDAMGMGGAYDIGPGRISWAATMITNWMGDDGFLHKLNVKLLTSNIVGDTTYCTGSVTEVSIEDGRGQVEIKFTLKNQNDEVSSVGNAVVMLPSREHGPVQLPLPR